MATRAEHGTPEAPESHTDRYLDEEELQSFPASDAHGDWAGPPTWLPGEKTSRVPDGAPDPAAPGGGDDAPGGTTAENGRPPGRGSRTRRRPSIDVAGIPLQADASLVVIAGLVAWSFWLRYSAVASRGGALLMALVATVAFFGSIVAHELAHALEARRRGLHVLDITLYVFGGATRITDEATRPIDQFALTVVGPWTSIALGCAFGLVATGADHLGAREVGEVAGELGWLNVVLGIFNLLPGAPLDGGRILDSIVWRVTHDRARAARVSATCGQVMGSALAALGIAEILFVFGGFIAGLWLVLIGVFLARAATAERRLAALRERLRGRRVADVVRPVPEVPADASVAWVVNMVVRRGGIDVVGVTGVNGAAGIVGALTLGDLRRVPVGQQHLHRAEEMMTPVSDLPSVQATAPATQLLPLLGGSPVVVRDGVRVRSLVTGRQLQEAMEWLPPLASPPDTWTARRSRAPAEHGGARPQAPRGRGDGRWAGSLRTSILAASGAVVVAAAGVVPLPLIEVSPGPAIDVPPILRTTGPSHPVDGKLLLTTVRLDAPSLAATVRALLDAHREVLGRTAVVPAGVDPADYETAQRQVFTDTVRLAAAVALRAAGYAVAIGGGGAVVRAVGAGGPATGALVPGDVIVAVTGQRVVSAADLTAHLSDASAGAPVALRIRRGDRQLTVRVSPVWSNDLERLVLDVAVEDAVPLVRLPFDVHLTRTDVGGPSGGLMTALAVYASTTGADLTAGRTVAGTGTIDAEGTVGTVGGIAEKVAAAAAAGATEMLVPTSEAAAARRAAGGDPIKVVPVTSFSDALARLQARSSS